MSGFQVHRQFGLFQSVPSRPGLRAFGIPEGGPWSGLAGEICWLLHAEVPFELAGEVHLEMERERSILTIGLESHADGVHSVGPGAVVFRSGSRPRGWLAFLSTPKKNVRFDLPTAAVGPLRFVPGEYVSLLHPRGTILPASSRMGVRVGGLGSGHSLELRSQPAMAGMIQVTPDGTGILLGPDAPTIGGYPVAGYIIEPDLDRLGQLQAPDEVVLEAVSESEGDRLAEEARLLRRRFLDLLSIALG